MSPLQQYTVRVLRRWPVIVVLALVGAASSVAWFFTTATTSYTATAALSTQSSERGPEQDAVLALGYVDYFNQDSYQELLRRDAGIPANITLEAMTGATSPILYISATGADEQAVRSAATVATDTFRNDVRENLIADRRRTAEDIQAEIDRNTAELTGPEVLQDVQVNIVLDQIRSLQGRLTDVLADNTNHLKPLQSEPGMASSTENPLVATVTGAVGGALLGVLVALLLAVTDSRVRNRTDVRARLGEDAVAELADVAPAERARLVRNLANALRLGGPSERTVVAVVAPRDSAAARRLARELAAAGASRRTHAVLVRADVTAPDEAWPGFLDALAGQADARASLMAAPDGLLVLPSGRFDDRGGGVARRSWSLVAPDQVTEIVDEIAVDCRLAVLAAPPLLEAPESQVVCAAADRVILVLERDRSRWSDAREAVRLLADVHAPIAGIVIDEPQFDGPPDPLRPLTADVADVVDTAGVGDPIVPEPYGDDGVALRTTELDLPDDDESAENPTPSPRPRLSAVPAGAPSENHQVPRPGAPDHE
ncbi:hypothetical protein BJF90_42215 [Pseudonocardia sp. CNS-004]|nr:hypothetical protein BJF90_42215 [Pseudonocardia sp. CNS-004]